MSTDQEVSVPVISLPRRVPGFYLTRKGGAALDADEAQLEHERAVAAEARQLAMQRRNQPIDGDPPALI